MKVIAIDPGGVTGWSTFSIPMDGDKPVWGGRLKTYFTRYGQLSGDHHDELDELLEAQRPDIIVCERFENRNNDFSLLISVEYIGVVKRYGQGHNIPVIMQGASQALVWCTNDKMEKLNLLVKPYQPNKDANASRKHLVYFLIFGERTPAIRLRLLEALR
jgi:hypothetical protein